MNYDLIRKSKNAFSKIGFSHEFSQSFKWLSEVFCRRLSSSEKWISVCATGNGGLILSWENLSGSFILSIDHPDITLMAYAPGDSSPSTVYFKIGKNDLSVFDEIRNFIEIDEK